MLSRSFDDAANAVEMDGYEVLTLRANWDVSEHVALFGRVENAWDEHYQTAAGYATEDAPRMSGRGRGFDPLCFVIPRTRGPRAAERCARLLVRWVPAVAE